MDKKTIRKKYLQKRMELRDSEIEICSQAMVDHFRRLRFGSITNILSYNPLLTRNEFSVADCELHLQHLFPSAKIYLPKINSVTFTMSAHQVTSATVHQNNQYGIAEPIDGPVISPALIDIAFVPLIAFDNKGYRVGYGKGYYDRFLSQCKPDLMTIGFSFFEAIEQIEGLDQFDVPLKFCISPTQIYEF